MTWKNEHLAHDWFPGTIPENITLEPNVYISTSYAFAAFASRMQPGLIMGEGSGIYNLSSVVTGPEGCIRVGAYTGVNSAKLAANQSVTIGAHCMIAWGAVITDSPLPRAGDLERHRSAMLASARNPLRPMPSMADPKPVHIADNVWIGFDSVVLGGVSIGRGAIIGCKTVITEDVPPYAIMVGNPCRKVRSLEADDSEDLRMAVLRSFGLEAAGLPT